MKAKRLSFPFIFFSESGLFKGLWAKKIKKSGSSQLASQVVENARNSSVSSRTPSAELDSANTYL
jgi:hypothetical protein